MFKTQPNVIAVAGKKGTGKTFAVHTLCSLLEGPVVAVNFGDKLKSICATTFDVPLSKFSDENHKEVILPEWGMSPRYMMTSMADIIKAKYGKDFFVNVVRNRVVQELGQGHMVLIGDLRHKAEVEWVRSQGFHVLHMQADPVSFYEATDHESEQGVEVLAHDRVVLNDYSPNVVHLLGLTLGDFGFQPI